MIGTTTPTAARIAGTRGADPLKQGLIVATATMLGLGALSPAWSETSLVPDRDRSIQGSMGGHAVAFHIASSILGKTRKVDVVFPASFPRTGPSRRYPVVVVLDGEYNVAATSVACDQLGNFGLIPECLVVAIENQDLYDGRVHDLTPPGLSVSGSGTNEGGDKFLDFIERELLPSVERQFRGGEPRTLIGHSSGGILATYAAATRPHFRSLIAIDAPVQLGQNWLIRKLAARAVADTTPLRFVSYEARFPWPDGAWDSLAAAAPRSWKLHRERLTGEAHESAFFLGAYLGLREVFADYSRLAVPVASTSVLPYYESLTASYGAPLVPPPVTLRNVVEDLAMEGRGAAARKAYGMLVTGYGAPADSARILSDIAEAEGRPAPTETVEGLLATPFPTPEEARPFLGEWIGDSWQTNEQPRPGRTILRVKVVDGKVVAELENPDAPEEARVQRMEYLKVTPVGLTFGFMNGMRPRGMILHEGVLKGDTLAGSTRWGGISFRYPEGMIPPHPAFSFRRVRH